MICAGETGPLQTEDADGLPADLVDDADGGIISGGQTFLVSSHKVLQDAAA
jgi:hypothetical protein